MFFLLYFGIKQAFMLRCFYFSKESCRDGEMWVSMLLLGAAEHPVSLLPGPLHPSLSVAASSLIK